jgi:hypothetical protein
MLPLLCTLELSLIGIYPPNLESLLGSKIDMLQPQFIDNVKDNNYK